MSTPQIVTFYSYKGGTGRSMALANVAWILAANGKRVLLIDWDLEAPGLHRYLHPFLTDKELVRSDGLIDFVLQYAELAVQKTKRPKTWYKPYANILRYATSLAHEFPEKGTIDFVPAGRQGADYATRVNAFNWQHFYERLSGGLFLEAAKLSMADYDYVLIDSRTGVSDTSGICTVQMPNILVVCFTLNTQSIEGAAAVAESARAQRRNAAGQSTLRILPVPTRVELTERDKLNIGMEVARERFDPLLSDLSGSLDEYWARVAVQYQPFYAFEEVLAVFGDSPGSPQSMLARMEALAGCITGTEPALQLPPVSQGARYEILARYLRQQRQESIYLVRRQTAHTEPVRAVAVSPDGQVVVSGGDTGVAVIWDLETGAEKERVGIVGSIRTAVFRSSSILIAGDNGCIIAWPLGASDLKNITRLDGKTIYGLAVTPDAKGLVYTAGNAVSIMDNFQILHTSHPFRNLGSHAGPVWAIAVTPDGKYAVSGSWDKILIRWDLAAGTSLMTYSGHTGEVSSVAVSDTVVLSGSYDNTLKLWDLITGSLIRTIEGHTGRVQAVALSADSRIAVSGSADKTVRVWDMTTGLMLQQLDGHSAAVNAVAITPDGRRAVSASDDGTVMIWNIEQSIAEKTVEPVAKETVPEPAYSDGASEGPVVFLSFSRRDRDRYFAQFVNDLEEALRRQMGESTQSETVFWWDDNLYGVDGYPDAVIDALRLARVAVCMTSPSYFETVNCGKEFSLFRMRARSGGGIYPIVWHPSDDWPDSISDTSSHEWKVPAYLDEGLEYMMRLSRHRLGYQTLLGAFVRDITRMARDEPLEPLAVLPPIETLPNAFGGRETELPEFGLRQVVFVMPSETQFGKPLTVVAQVVTAELELFFRLADRAEYPSILEKTALANSVLVVIFDSTQKAWATTFIGQSRSEASHCAMLMITAAGPLSVWKPPRNIGYFSGTIQTESALRDNIRTAILKIRQAMISKAAEAGGDESPSTEAPPLPTTS